MAQLFTSTSSIRRAVTIINQLDIVRFPLILLRISQRIHVKEESAFSAEEEEKLQAALELSAEELSLLLSTLEFVFQQAAYHAARPAVLSEQLQALGVENDKTAAIVETWSTSAKAIIDGLRKYSVAPEQLDGVSWRLHLAVAQKSKSKQKAPGALLALHVTDNSSSKEDTVHIEFNHKQLFEFYNQLETIQHQLDSLS